ncbi:MAG: hydroxymethylglutaryl-CoA lyase [Alphaproteobacteria bacterium]
MVRPKKVLVGEVGPRDGLQIEKDFVPTATKIELINGLIDAGVREIEYSSFVSPRAVPQLADAAEVLAALERPDGVHLVALVPNAKGAARAVETDVDELRVFVSASESHNRKNVNRSVEESLQGFEEVVRIAHAAGRPVSGAIATSFGCPFEGDVPVEQVVRIAERFAELGMVGISLGDTTGMATPPLVAERCRHLKAAVPDLPVTLHFHNTRGIGLANVMAGLDEGIDRYEGSFAGLGGCPFAPGATGNICTEDLVFLLHEMGIETGIDLEKLCAVARRVEQVVGRTLPGQVMKAGPRLALSSMDQVETAVG